MAPYQPTAQVNNNYHQENIIIIIIITIPDKFGIRGRAG